MRRFLTTPVYVTAQMSYKSVVNKPYLCNIAFFVFLHIYLCQSFGLYSS